MASDSSQSDTSHVASTGPAATPVGKLAKGKAVEDSKTAKAKTKGKAEPVVQVEEEADPSWHSRLFTAIESWSSSIIVHAVILIVLALLSIPMEKEETFEQVMEIPRERPDEQLTQELDPSTDPTEATSFSAASSAAPSMSAAASDIGQIASSAQAMDAQVMKNVEGNPAENVGLADVSLRNFGTGTLTTELGKEFKGEPAEVVDNYDQAMDRLTREILLMMQKSKVLVVWVFDQSNSMKDDQEEIRLRIEKVYQELGLLGKTKDDTLLTAVVSYGEGYLVHTKRPTNDLNEIRMAIASVPVDESGKEMMCSAVGETSRRFSGFAAGGRRRLAMVLVSDESGEEDDNYQNLELALQTAKQANCRIYCLGREAVFGYPYARLRWVHEETGLHFWRTINRGPETPLPEQLQTDGFHARWDAHPSGFGPYDQVRLCRETGGVFFMLPSLESNLVRGEKRKYELQAMRHYLPDLNSRAEYSAERDKVYMRSLLWKIITDLNPHKNSEINLRYTFPLAGPELVQAINTAQLHAEKVVRYYDLAEKELEKLAKERQQETSPRWQANYDLMYAQVLSYKVRVFEYGAFLEQFKRNPDVPMKIRTTHWHIYTRGKTITGDLTKEYIDRATEMFHRIMEDHPGTPYAARAQWELNRGYGVYFREHYHDPRYDRMKIDVPNF